MKHPSQKLFSRLQSISLPLVVAILTCWFGTSAPSALAAGVNACNATARAAATSCASGARSDYMLALGKCANIADPAARKACQDQAKTDLKDAMDLCKAQTAARLAACARLGGATYEPSIV